VASSSFLQIWATRSAIEYGRVGSSFARSNMVWGGDRDRGRGRERRTVLFIEEHGNIQARIQQPHANRSVGRSVGRSVDNRTTPCEIHCETFDSYTPNVLKPRSVRFEYFSRSRRNVPLFHPCSRFSGRSRQVPFPGSSSQRQPVAKGRTMDKPVGPTLARRGRGLHYWQHGTSRHSYTIMYCCV
jgi:hypothetical protein